MPSQPAQPTPAAPLPVILGLRVFNEADSDKKRSQIAEADPRFLATAAVLDLGIRLLEHPDGRRNLELVGIMAISKLEDHEHIYDKKNKNPANAMSEWVKLFLARLRGTFPSVVLTNHTPGEAAALRYNWARGGKTMRQWDPSTSGIFKLNKYIMEGLINAARLGVTEKDQARPYGEAFDAFMFLMAITIAHELCHLFIGFLVGYDRPKTPETLSYLPELYNSQEWDGTRVGESGRSWEGNTFGGIVETFEDTKHPLQKRQPGMMVIIDSHKFVRHVPAFKIKALLACNPQVSLKLLTPDLISKPSISLSVLDHKHKSMQQVRREVLFPTATGPMARPRSVSGEELSGLIQCKKVEVRDRIRIRSIPMLPKLIFTKA